MVQTVYQSLCIFQSKLIYMPFKVGDVVELKSEGPKMTIQKIIGVTTSKDETYAYVTKNHYEGDLVCQWFLAGKVETGQKKADSVRMAE
jgi:uncharacterized protein YodC (DUF2158 family)